jgi:hypothetical protein
MGFKILRRLLRKSRIKRLTNGCFYEKLLKWVFFIFLWKHHRVYKVIMSKTRLAVMPNPLAGNWRNTPPPRPESELTNESRPVGRASEKIDMERPQWPPIRAPP